MKKNINNFLKIILFGFFIGILALLQITFINWFDIFGVKINLVLIGILANIFNPSWPLILVGTFIGGLVYDFTSLFNFTYTISFLILVLLFRFLGRKYLVEKHLFLNFFFGFLGTIIFNFLYVSINYFFFRNNFFGYFLSWNHLLEIGINAFLVFLLGLIGEAFKITLKIIRKQ
ncbi:MAG: hypothetical protein ACPLKV_02480 [Minisyncoccia bacterium]